MSWLLFCSELLLNHSAYNAAGWNKLPLSGTFITISNIIGNDTKYGGNRFASSSSGIAIIVHM